jgi:outer membrane immunogenic protein
MIRVLIAGAFGLVLGRQALAADVLPQVTPVPPPAYAPVPSLVQNWGGFYVGINGGYGFGSSNWSDINNPGNSLIGGTTPPGTSTGDFRISGPLAGATIGLNYQIDSFVLGVESDFEWSGIQGSVTPANGFCNLIVSASAVGSTCETKADWLGTARLRLGYVFDRVLVYGTGGAAFGNVHAGLTGSGLAGFAPAGGSFQNNAVFGWTAGAGVEVAFLEGWTAKLEYLYLDLGSATCNIQATCGIDSITFTGTTPANDTVKFNTSVVRIGVNYRFGSW